MYVSEYAVMEVKETETRRTVRFIYCRFFLALVSSRLVPSCFFLLACLAGFFRNTTETGLGLGLALGLGLGLASWLSECCVAVGWMADGRHTCALYVTNS